MRFVARSGGSARWPHAMPACKPNGASISGSASISATLSSTTTTSSATGSTSQRALKAWRNQAASASAGWYEIRYATSSPSRSRTWASSRSRTSPGRCAFLAETAERPSILPDTAAPRPLPERPSIAVLPFNNVSGDPEQDYFVDGITEDIITALSKWRWFLVIARNSTFAYKGKSVDLKEVGRDLGVRYVLEGSMRRAGQRVRVSSQLIDIATGTHLWAERYDRDLTDIFAVQDDITSRVAAAIEPALSRAESERVIA